MLTDDEIKALTTILDKAFEEAEDGDPEFQEVNIKDVNPFADETTQTLVYAALSKKGFIDGSLFEDVTGRQEEFVCITPSGIEALKATKGVH